MQLKEFDILLDIKKHIKHEYIEVVKDDFETNILNLALLDGNNVYRLDGLNVEIAFSKADGKTILQDEENGIMIINPEQGKIQCTLNTNTIAVSGRVLAEVRVLEGVKILTTARFEFFVRKAIVNDDTVQSTNEFPVLQKLINDVEVIKPMVPRIENLDLDLLEQSQERIAGLENDKLDKTEFDRHKEDYTQQRSQDQLKVAKVEKELDDYQKVMSQVNVNQEAKQKVSGYGVVSLPKNSANGQVSSVMKGRTLKNELNYTRDTWAEWQNKGSAVVSNKYLVIDNNTSNVGAYLPTNVKPSTKYGILVNVRLNTRTIATTLVNPSAGNYPFNTVLSVKAGQIGNFKSVQTTNTSFSIGNALNTSILADTGRIEFGDYRLFELPTGSEIETDFNTMTADQLAIKYPYIKGDSAKSTISAMRLRSKDSQGAVKSTAYITAKKDNKIVNLRSVSTAKDEIRVSGGKAEHIKKNNKKVLEVSDISSIVTSTTNVDYVRINKPSDYLGYNVLNAGISFTLENYTTDTFVGSGVDNVNSINKVSAQVDNTRFILVVAKGTFSSLVDAQSKLVGKELTYQLRDEIVTPIQVSGNIVSYPGGTVIIEKVVPDAGIYNNGIATQHTDLPIKSIDILIKYDFTTGMQTVLDSSKSVINPNKLSFTHPDLANGDMVFFDYFYDKESTEGEVEIEYYDSRHTIKDTTNGKFYKWNIKSTNGVPSTVLTEV